MKLPIIGDWAYSPLPSLGGGERGSYRSQVRASGPGLVPLANNPICKLSRDPSQELYISIQNNTLFQRFPGPSVVLVARYEN